MPIDPHFAISEGLNKRGSKKVSFSSRKQFRVMFHLPYIGFHCTSVCGKIIVLTYMSCPGGHWPRKGVWECAALKTPFSRLSCRSQGSHFKQKSQFTRPLLRTFRNFSLNSLNFHPKFSSQAPKFGNFQLTSPQIWKFSAHKPPNLEIFSSQAPLFRGKCQFTSPTLRKSGPHTPTWKKVECPPPPGVMHHLDHPKALTDAQHCFCARQSCETQLLTKYKIWQANEDMHHADAIIFDFAKAFETVPQHKLLYKFYHFCIKGSFNTSVDIILPSWETAVRQYPGRYIKTSWIDVWCTSRDSSWPHCFLPDDLTSHVYLFADDCLVFRLYLSDCDKLPSYLFSSFTAMLNEIQLPLLQDRCLNQRLFTMHKIIHNNVDLHLDNHLKFTWFNCLFNQTP